LFQEKQQQQLNPYFTGNIKQSVLFPFEQRKKECC